MGTWYGMNVLPYLFLFQLKKNQNAHGGISVAHQIHWSRRWYGVSSAEWMSKWVNFSRERALRLCCILHSVLWWSKVTDISSENEIFPYGFLVHQSSLGKHFLCGIKWCHQELFKSWWEEVHFVLGNVLPSGRSVDQCFWSISA